METLVHWGLTNAAIATGLAVVVALASRFCRRPALVHGLWLLVFLRLVVPPLWGFHIAWPLDQRMPSQVALPTENDKVQPPPAQSPNRRSSHESSTRRPAPLKTHALTTRRPNAEAIRPALPMVRFTWEALVSLIWLAGAAGWWLTAGIRVYAFRKALGRLSPAPTALQERVRQFAQRLSVRRCPVVYLMDAPTAPLLWALFGTPRLILPGALWERLTEEQRNTMLVHELAHLRRRDHWMRRLEFLVLGLYWWHPVAWWAYRRMQEAEEQCCDAWVVWALPDQAPAYAEALLAAAAFFSLSRPTLPVGASGVGQFHRLQRRLTMILQARTPRRLTWTVGAAFLACAAVVLSFGPLWAQSGPADGPQWRTNKKTTQAERTTPPATNTSHIGRNLTNTWEEAVPPTQDGDVLDAQDTVDLLKAQLEGKKAELQEATALLQQAQAQLKRAETLKARQLTGASEIDAARTDVAVKEAHVRVKQAQIKEGEVRLRQAMRHLAQLRRTRQQALPVPPQALSVPSLPATNVGGLRALTLQLESAVTWDAVSESWRTRRDGWVKDVLEANSVPRLAESIEELEGAVLWSAVTPSWAERRPGWIQDCSQAHSASQLAKLLGELETYITWEAVTPAWKDVRDSWITNVANCKAL